MDIIFSFDSEDFLTPEAADAEKWWAEALTARGVTGSFQIVAELIRTLKQRGREDVIAAFAQHEIGYHSNLHSVPPSIPERIEGLSFGQSIEEILRTESAGLATLVETFGRVPVTYCSPGDSWTPATLVAMGMLGIKGFCNTRTAEVPVPYWYCGALHFNYDLCLERYFEKNDAEFFKAFDETAAAIQARMERILDRLLSRRDLKPTTYAALYAAHAAQRADLATLMEQAGLRPGEEGRLVDVPAALTPYIPPETFAAFSYRWPLYREGFTGAGIIQQAQQLAWTSAPAARVG